MIRFNILNVEKVCSGWDQIADFIQWKVQGKPKYIAGLAKYFRSAYYPSFIINPEKLIAARRLFSSEYISSYIILAGRRNYWDYYSKGWTFLDMNLYPEIKTNRLSLNPLLDFRDNRIYFRYEEN